MKKAFTFIKNIFDIISYLMAITLAIDVIMLLNGFGHLGELIEYILNYFV